ncbi:MAG: hypothetical protein Q9187_003010 [Circinaria calcarea]
MQFSKAFLVSILSLASVTTAQFDDGDFAIAAREADPFAGAFAEAVADAHPLAIAEIHDIYSRAVKAAKGQVCARELSPRCFTLSLVCQPSNGRTVIPESGLEHGNRIPVDCKQITECKRGVVVFKKNAGRAVPLPALAACRRICGCE